MTRLLYGVEAADPATFPAASCVLVLAVIAAGCSPARRAVRVSPIEILPCE